MSNCPDCDNPLSTQADYNATAEGEGADLCWREWNGDVCILPKVDWRARALNAKESLNYIEDRDARVLRGLFDEVAALQSAASARDVSIFALTRRVDYLMHRLRDLAPTAAVLSAFRARYAGPLSEGQILDDVIDALNAACQSGRVAGNGQSDHRGEMEGVR